MWGCEAEPKRTEVSSTQPETRHRRAESVAESLGSHHDWNLTESPFFGCYGFDCEIKYGEKNFPSIPHTHIESTVDTIIVEVTQQKRIP